jgi:hypothetical protein
MDGENSIGIRWDWRLFQAAISRSASMSLRERTRQGWALSSRACHPPLRLMISPLLISTFWWRFFEIAPSVLIERN